jgi:hypothetical protein
LQQFLHPRETGLSLQKNIVGKPDAYSIGEDPRLNSCAVEDYDNDAHGLITTEGRRNQELINAW